MQRAFDEIDAALADGEIVGIFPEGALTKDGEIAPFKSGVETHPRARASAAAVPVVPMALRSMWSSMWSRRDGRLGRMRVPRRFRAHVEVVADAPLDAARRRRRSRWKRGCANCAATRRDASIVASSSDWPGRRSAVQLARSAMFAVIRARVRREPTHCSRRC